MLFIQDSNGFSPATKAQVISAAINYAATAVRRGAALSNPSAVRDWLKLTIGGLEYEVFIVVFIDSRNRVIAYEQMFRGTIDGASVHPREVVKAALLKNAAAVILVHNHPSDICEPSHADEIITRRLKDALALIEIRVLDHLVVGTSHVTSFAERGML
jgi:DNA repair protein RadC